MGIFQRLYTLLESACHELDVKLARLPQSIPVQAKEAYKQYAEMLKEIQAEEEKHAAILLAARSYEQMAVELALQSDSTSTVELVANLRSEAEKLCLEANLLVSTYI